MPERAHAELWDGRYWNKRAGRVAWWLSHDTGPTARAAARMFYGVLVRADGEQAAREQLAVYGFSELPVWLIPPKQPLVSSNITSPAMEVE